MVVRLLFNFGTPVPSGGQSTIDARPGVKEVIRAGAIERVAEVLDRHAVTERVGRLTPASHGLGALLQERLAVFVQTDEIRGGIGWNEVWETETDGEC